MDNRAKMEEALGRMMTGAWMTQAVYVAAELGIADVLADKSATARELSSATGVGEEGLARVMRALCSVGVFRSDGDGKYELSELGALLQAKTPGSKRAFARISGAEIYGSWGGLLESVKSGKQAFCLKYGKEFFEYMSDNPARWAIYDEAMNGIHGPETLPMIDAYDFGRFFCLIDVGGGNGSTLALILKRHPKLKGILHELPDVVGRARETFAQNGLSKRAFVTAGNFFESVPEGGDAYLLRHVIHDWNDEDAARILTNCRTSMKPGGKALVVESVIPEGDEPCFVKWLDLMMMVVGGRERTVGQYEKLFRSAGFRLANVIPTACEVSILEAEVI